MIERLSLPEKDAPYGISIIHQSSVTETYPSHCHDFYEIFYVASGKGVHCIGDQRLLLETGSLVLIRPDDVHSFSAFNSFDFTMYSIGFSVQEMQRAMDYMGIFPSHAEKPSLPPAAVLPGHERAGMEKALAGLLQQQSDQRLTPFRALLPGVLLRLVNPSAPVAAEVFPAWLARLDEQMSLRDNYVQGLPRMLELCPCTQAYMNRAFKRYMKLTPTEYINIKRIHYACELLTDHRHDVAEVCYMTGFNNLSHFYAMFRRICRCTPGDLMKRTQG